MSLLSRLKHPGRLLTLSLMVLPILLMACSLPSAGEQDKNWTDSSDLIKTSDRILVTRFVDFRLQNIQRIDSITGAIAGDIDVLFRQFEVFENLKGTTDSGDLIWLAFEPGTVGELVDGQGQLKNFDKTKTYVMFLKGRLRPLEYPTEYGAVLWTANGEPAIAELIGDELKFIAERPYLDLLSRDGITLPDTTSASPFTLTLTEARDATN